MPWLANELAHCKNSLVRYTLIIAVGLAQPGTLGSDAQVWADMPRERYVNDPVAGVHSACKWALNRWKLDLPPLNPDDIPPKDRAWCNLRLGKSVLEFVKLPPGSFKRGSGSRQSRRYYVNKLIEIPRSLWISSTEITEAEVSAWNNDDQNRENLLPARIKYVDVAELCNRLTAELRQRLPLSNDGCFELGAKGPEMQPGRAGIRLPTPDEWEYACRADVSTPFFWGNQGDIEICKHFAVFDAGGNLGSELVPVGQRIPNFFGLFDPTGNAWEMTVFFPDEYDDPNFQGVFDFLNRGGGWNADRQWLNIGSFMEMETPTMASGVRLVLDLNGE